MQLGSTQLSATDVVFADDDGVLVVNSVDVGAVLEVAAEIAHRERAQAERIRAGESLRQQLRFHDYLAQQRQNPAYTFRDHLTRLGGAVEV